MKPALVIYSAVVLAVLLGEARAAARYPETYGAVVNDGIDDTLAIQAAVNAAGPGDTIQFSAGTYTMLPRNLPNTSRDWRGVIYKSNLTFLGSAGGQTVLKLPDHFQSMNPANTAGDMWMFDTQGPTSNVVFQQIKFDFNGPNNLLTQEGPVSHILGIAACSRASFIQVYDCEFSQNPGRQCIWINWDGGGGIGDFNRVERCTFMDMGEGLPGNYCNDHSSVYINGNNSSVRDNTFTNAKTGNVTAIEVHGRDVRVENNVQNTGGTFCILTSDVSEVSGEVRGNMAIDSWGIVLWPLSNYDIDNVTIADNTIVGGNVACIRELNAGGRVRNVTIRGNHLSAVDPTQGTHGIYSQCPAQENLNILDNDFDHLGGYGIWRAAPTNTADCASQDIDISNNTFADICRRSGYGKAIYLQNGNFTDVQVHNNRFTGNSIGTYLHIYGHTVENVRFVSNTYPLKDTWDLPFVLTATNAIRDPVVVHWWWIHLLSTTGTYLGPGSIAYDLTPSPWKRCIVGGTPATATWIPAIPGDVNGDTTVNDADVAAVLASMDAKPDDANWNVFADLDYDGEITSSDLSMEMVYSSAAGSGR